ncbi:unnamed protein product [Tetraodon nigroviridis]|uniref:(spotted green pufferfish) hypothetical protein n=1 Tax=Tetraodon nigroviridis TaxID=99883 RepID=Q4RWI6_TETNG|nr:unnamed protein product [Tetraodon nigroviridis]
MVKVLLLRLLVQLGNNHEASLTRKWSFQEFFAYCSLNVQILVCVFLQERITFHRKRKKSSHSLECFNMALCTCHITNSTFGVLVVLTAQEKNHVCFQC